MMDGDLSTTTSANDLDSELSEGVEAAWDHAWDNIASDMYHQAEEDFTFVNLHDNQPVDETLGRAWDVLHAKDDIKADRNPDLPWHHDPRTVSWDEVLDREVNWAALSQDTRRNIASAAKETDELKDQAKRYFGLEIKTPADVLAIKKALNDVDHATAPVWNDLGISARNNLEGIRQLEQIASQVRRDPYNGWRNVLQQNGINPAWLVQPHEYGYGVPQHYQHLVPQAQPAQDNGMAYKSAVVEDWKASNPGADEDTIALMAEIIRSPGFKQERTALKTLNKAYKQAKARRGSKSARQKSNEGLDAAVSSAAEGLFDE